MNQQLTITAPYHPDTEQLLNCHFTFIAHRSYCTVLFQPKKVSLIPAAAGREYSNVAILSKKEPESIYAV
ncbi:MAG: hypothetical protein IPP22_02690 [Nitrosomonas sp.]|nr:hypothetical protein [Nitrosomonas sp.]